MYPRRIVDRSRIDWCFTGLGGRPCAQLPKYIHNRLFYISISFIDMSQFSLGSANSHWGYGSAGYTPYLTSNGLSSCGGATAAQFNNPALGFTCSSEQNVGQDFGTSTRECVPSKCVL